jgi:hypothetical protein
MKNSKFAVPDGEVDAFFKLTQVLYVFSEHFAENPDDAYDFQSIASFVGAEATEMVRRVKAQIGDKYKYTMSWLYVRGDEVNKDLLKFSPKLRGKDEIFFTVAKEEAPGLYRKMSHLFDAVCSGQAVGMPLAVRPREAKDAKKVRFSLSEFSVCELHPLEINHMIKVDGLSKVSIDVGMHNKARVAASVDAILALAKEEILALLA